ncbi:ABC transporter permease [Patescibacteria group bacterium]|nr:ABC transporter permease [Patescibacteria group bacterium]MBU2259700.1 ABC transporter permease [Patescibacteria group bacterium]
MLLKDTISAALEGLKRSRMRSLLTTLGIVIGVGSVVLMVSIGASFERFIVDQVESFSGDTFEIHAKGVQDIGKDVLSITFGDLEAIRNLTTVKNVSPAIFLTDRIKYGREEIAPMILGTTKEIFENWSMKAGEGRLLTDEDDKGAKSVVVLGSQAAEDLFQNENPLGKRLTIGARKFTVVGILETMGSPLTAELDSMVYVPFSVAKAIKGRTTYIDYIALQSISGDNELTRRDIVSLLRQRHNIDNPEDDIDKDDFYARSLEQAMEIIETVTMSITLFLGLIASISLLVGGVGIMNIMLVSVTERTKEIGLRKAVGARRRDILIQFLLEAIVLTLIGGIVGVIGAVSFGYLISLIASKFLGDLTYALSIQAILLPLITAIAVGLIFGIYPARKAAALQPIEAMGYE